MNGYSPSVFQASRPQEALGMKESLQSPRFQGKATMAPAAAPEPERRSAPPVKRKRLLPRLFALTALAVAGWFGYKHITTVPIDPPAQHQPAILNVLHGTLVASKDQSVLAFRDQESGDTLTIIGLEGTEDETAYLQNFLKDFGPGTPVQLTGFRVASKEGQSDSFAVVTVRILRPEDLKDHSPLSHRG
jgi:hypothetical protein